MQLEHSPFRREGRAPNEKCCASRRFSKKQMAKKKAAKKAKKSGKKSRK